MATAFGNSTSSTEPTTSEESTNGLPIPWMIIIGAGGGGGALLLIVVVVVVVVCLRRRRRKRKERELVPPMPNVEDLPLEPESADKFKYQRRNSDTDINNVRSNEQLNDFQLFPTPKTPNSRSPPIAPEIYDSSDDDDDQDYVNNPTPDYENNPISLAKAKEEAELRLQQRRNGPGSPLSQSQLLNPTARHPVPLKHAHTMKPEANAGADGTTPGAARGQWSPQDEKCPGRDHIPWKKQAYINTSRSLEELDKRVVPPPPLMPGNDASLAKKKPPGPAPPPKSHKGPAKGYVNQLPYESKNRF